MNRQNLRNLVVILVTALAIIGALLLIRQPWRDDGGSGGQGEGASTPVDIDLPAGQAAPKVGQPAPDFTATTIDGQTLTLSEADQPVWLLFGATWCTNCRLEAPDVAAIAEAYQGRAQVVAVYIGEDAGTVQRYADRVGLAYPQIADTADTIAAAYAVMGIPAHFFIGTDGTIGKIAVGQLSRASAAGELDALLEG